MRFSRTATRARLPSKLVGVGLGGSWMSCRIGLMLIYNFLKASMLSVHWGKKKVVGSLIFLGCLPKAIVL